MPIVAAASPAKSLLNAADHILLLIDHQSQMAFPVRSQDVLTLRLNTRLVAEAAAGFGVTTILTSVAADTFSGPLFEEITQAMPDAPIIDRTTMNCWEDQNVIDAVNAAQKPRIVIGGL